MTFGLYGIAWSADYAFSPKEILSKVAEAFKDDRLTEAAANECLLVLESGKPLSAEDWRNLLSTMHSARRDWGIVPNWSSVAEGIYIQQRIIDWAARGRR